MRWLALFLAALILALQYPMWLGKGGWLTVREYDRQLAEQRAQNASLKARNDALEADVRDLKTGTEAIEERARNELGMIRQDEVFVQLQRASPAPRAEMQASATTTGGASGARSHATSHVPTHPATQHARAGAAVGGGAAAAVETASRR